MRLKWVRLDRAVTGCRDRYTSNTGLECGKPWRPFRAAFCRTHPQQKQQAISPSDRRAGATRLNYPANHPAPLR